MKKFALILSALGVMIIGAGAANPVAAQYPPTSVTFIVTVSFGPPGFGFTTVVAGCVNDTPVTFTVPGFAPVTTTCANGQATADFTAPTTEGDYPVSVTYTDPVTGLATSRSSQITVLDAPVAPTTTLPVTAPPGGLLPATGSSGLSGNLLTAGTLILVGLGLLVVTQVRRHTA